MKIRRFLGKDSRSAMAQVRADMGPDAVILSSKKINGQVELVVAMDFDEERLSAQLNTNEAIYQGSTTERYDETSRQEPLTNAGAEHSAGDTASLSDLHQELGNLRSLLEGKLSQLAWRDMAGRPSVKSTIQNRLAKLGLSRTLCGEIVDNLPLQGALEDHWQTAQRLLAQKISVMPGDSVLNDGGIIALVGSTGVGKTTTIAKLAARSVLRYGSNQVALITTDCYRIGGQEQLEAFAKYLGVPMIVATNQQQLKAALAQFSSRRMVLIDTAGMSQRDIRLYEQFSLLNNVGYDISTYVVLSATAQQRALHEVVKVFGQKSLAGAMITKVDESAGLGGILDVVIKKQLALSYISTGQKVPEDLIPARVEYLVDSAVDLMKKNAIVDSSSATKNSDKNPTSHALAV